MNKYGGKGIPGSEQRHAKPWKVSLALLQLDYGSFCRETEGVGERGRNCTIREFTCWAKCWA